MFRIAFIAISITACAAGASFRVHDENGWPVPDWDARHDEVLAFRCPSMPFAYYLAAGTRTPLVLEHELSATLYTKFCAAKPRGEQLVILTAEHRSGLAARRPMATDPARTQFKARGSKFDATVPVSY